MSVESCGLEVGWASPKGRLEKGCHQWTARIIHGNHLLREHWSKSQLPCNVGIFVEEEFLKSVLDLDFILRAQIRQLVAGRFVFGLPLLLESFNGA